MSSLLVRTNPWRILVLCFLIWRFIFIRHVFHIMYMKIHMRKCLLSYNVYEDSYEKVPYDIYIIWKMCLSYQIYTSFIWYIWRFTWESKQLIHISTTNHLQLVRDMTHVLCDSETWLIWYRVMTHMKIHVKK